VALILYDYPAAPSPRRARIALAEKRVEFESVIVDLAAGAHLREDYRAINPACTVPALRLDDGTILTENAGIAAYLEAAHPEPKLLGRTAVEKGFVASWNARISYEGLMAVAEALRNAAAPMRNRALTGSADFAQIPELAARGLRRIALFFDMLNEHLRERLYVATDQFTLADITAVVTVDFARVVRCKPGPEHAHLLRWRASLADRPSLAA
jgi:glutathione S-transferase